MVTHEPGLFDGQSSQIIPGGGSYLIYDRMMWLLSSKKELDNRYLVVAATVESINS